MQLAKIPPRVARPPLRKGAFRFPPLSKEGQGGFRQVSFKIGSRSHTAKLRRALFSHGRDAFFGVFGGPGVGLMFGFDFDRCL